MSMSICDARILKMRITNHKANGVLIDFGNGIQLSTIWSLGSYTDNHDIDLGEDVISSSFEINNLIDNGSTTVEILFTSGDEDFIRSIYEIYGSGTNIEDSIGYLSVSDWIDIVCRCKSFNKINIPIVRKNKKRIRKIRI